MRVFISAGEASGDVYAAFLIGALRARVEKDPLLPFEISFRDLVRMRTPVANKHVPPALEKRTMLGISEALSELDDHYSIDIADEEHGLPWEELLLRLHGNLPKEVRQEWETPIFEGMGGYLFELAGAKTYANSAHWGAISIVQSLAVYPKIVGSYYRLKKKLKQGIPGIFIPIDFGYANIRLARHAKNHGWKVLYFVPPGSWRKDRQGGDLPQITDAISTPFSWSAEILNRMGANAHWFGHPIKEINRNREEPAERKSLAILPGSRDHEIEANLPVIAEALRNFEGVLEFAVPSRFPSIEPKLRERWQALSGRRYDLFTTGKAADVLRKARAGVVCSGTATLEAAVADCPMAVLYRLTPAMRREGKILMALGLFKRPKYISLPNIILDRPAVPELIDVDATPTALRDWADKLMGDSPERKQQLADFRELNELLGSDDAITKTADLAIQLMLSR